MAFTEYANIKPDLVYAAACNKWRTCVTDGQLCNWGMLITAGNQHPSSDKEVASRRKLQMKPIWNK